MLDARRPFRTWLTCLGPWRLVAVSTGEHAIERPNSAIALLTFYVVGQEGHPGHIAAELAADLLIRSFLHLGTGIDSIVVGWKERLDIPGRLTIFHIGEELELSLNAARWENGKLLPSLLPCLERGDYVVKERGLEMSLGKTRFPKVS
jgi:hypothetical protein